MVVMWNEKPMPSFFSSSRVLSQPSLTIFRSVFSASCNFLTIICLPRSNSVWWRVLQGRPSGALVEAVFLFAFRLQGLGEKILLLGDDVDLLQHLGDALLDDIEAFFKVLVGDHQAAQALHHMVVGATGLDDEAFPEGRPGDLAGQLAAHTVEALEHAATPGSEVTLAVFFDNAGKALRHVLALADDVLREAVVAPVMIDGRLGGDEGHVVAPESAVVLPGTPLVELGFHQHHGKGQAIAAQGFRQGDDIRVDARFLETEEGAGAAATGL